MFHFQSLVDKNLFSCLNPTTLRLTAKARCRWSAQMPLVSCCAPLLLCSLLESPFGMWNNQTNGPSDSSPLRAALFLNGHPAFSRSKSGGERAWDAPRKEQLGTACNCKDNLCSLKSILKGSVERTGRDQARQAIPASLIWPWGSWVSCFRAKKEVDGISPAK